MRLKDIAKQEREFLKRHENNRTVVCNEAGQYGELAYYDDDGDGPVGVVFYATHEDGGHHDNWC